MKKTIIPNFNPTLEFQSEEGYFAIDEAGLRICIAMPKKKIEKVYFFDQLESARALSTKTAYHYRHWGKATFFFILFGFFGVAYSHPAIVFGIITAILAGILGAVTSTVVVETVTTHSQLELVFAKGLDEEVYCFEMPNLDTNEYWERVFKRVVSYPKI